MDFDYLDCISMDPGMDKSLNREMLYYLDIYGHDEHYYSESFVWS